MEDAILEYLEHYGQPQAVAAIHECCAPLEERGTVEAVLEEMRKARKIKLVQAGVQANGEPTVEYAPKSFDAGD